MFSRFCVDLNGLSAFLVSSYDLRSLEATPQNLSQRFDSQRLMLCIDFQFLFNFLWKEKSI